ncbi:MAG TPA: GH25 family lysozyme, partial [Gaiellaceae bacterium]|nr:GH25 family lysozyme [Gaiellaceae bacterium]
MGVPIGMRRGRHLVLAGVAIALIALLSASASSGATVQAKGLDVSTWNGTIRWAKVAAAGYTFAFGKATEGTSYS